MPLWASLGLEVQVGCVADSLAWLIAMAGRRAALDKPAARRGKASNIGNMPVIDGNNVG